MEDELHEASIWVEFLICSVALGVAFLTHSAIVKMLAPVADDNSSTSYDEIITTIVDYAYDFDIQSPVAWIRAKATLLDALGAAFESIHTSAECVQLIGPTFPGTAVVPTGFRLPGTVYQLDALKGAFDMGAMIRYLDHNDAFPGAEWGHPSGRSRS